MKRTLARIRPRTWIITAAVVVAVVGGGAVYWFGFALPAQATSSQPATRTVQASTQTLQKTVSATGTLSPTVSEDVNFLPSGTVTAVNVAAGATVTAGEVLATVDTVSANATLLQAKADLASAQAKLSDAQDASTGSTADVAAVAAAQAQVTSAQSSVDTAQTALDGTTLVAPVAGLVTAVNVAVGDAVTGTSGSTSSSSSSGSGASSGSGGSTGGGATGGTGTTGSGTGSSTSTSTAQFTIVGTGSWEVDLTVSASDLKSIAKNDQVELSTSDNDSFFGTVTSIGQLPSTTSGSAAYPVVVSVTGSPENLYDGVSVTAAIVYERRTDVLTVPSAAITTANGKSTVTKVVDGKNVTTDVTVGETSGTVTEITKGLSSGDSVLVTVFTPGSGAGTGGSTGQTGQTGQQGQFPGGGEGFTGGGEGGQFPGGGQGGQTGNGGTRNG
ncbi:efflux RND transporter periplasmic adaptor subunit [Leifsonia aquatica]|uniref:Efflux transporter, RND family, MFP subunit n=2 Tax=Leifsonia aquatica TaxID=144185 RepID=U2SWS8_LEIAQ|nr:biotin/lipoyl-binding protein [Leifsonia aquatica]ERK69738.1 efflux transporter, RND family, MFP subunit [Leifsonia aquatica ATCC 14665]MBB2968838.1 macrolide-specific efflux system membrane fusion protein [Leifsonia aquatica]